MLVLQMMLASAGDICFAAVGGFCWWCLDLLLMLVLGGCSDNIAVQKTRTKTVKAETSHKHIQKTHWNTQIVAQTLQNGGLGISFRHPYNINEAFWDTLGPKSHQSGPLGSILSAQGRHNEIF